MLGSWYFPLTVAFAAGISVSGGGAKTVGQTFTVTVKASGAEFDSLQGTISVSGPVDVVSFGAGSATWLPGKTPSNGNQFVGIVSPTSSLTVATIKLKGKSVGSGSVSVGGVKLARNGSYVGTDGGSTSFTIGRAPTPPGGVTVTSSTHPDQNAAYEATTVAISWTAPANGAVGYSYAWDQVADTAPAAKANTTATTATFENQPIGTYYFHIRANNADGWGATTHFKVTIKEPDAKVDTTLSAPTIVSVAKAGNFLTDVEKGTVSGLVIKGAGGLTGYTVNLTFDPKDRLPAELFTPVVSGASSDKSAAEVTPATTPATTTTAPVVSLTPLQATSNADGSWQIALSYPIPSGFYKLTAQGQKEKVLTPASGVSYLEVSVANGGSVKFVTADDLPKSATASGMMVFGLRLSTSSVYWLLSLVILLALIGSAVGWVLWKRKKRT